MLRVTIIACMVFFSASAMAQESFERPACGVEGGVAGCSMLSCPAQCCANLTPISQYQHKRFMEHRDCAKAKEEGKIPPPGSGNTCTQCGDGKCDEPEDSCNCPADCKK